MIEGLEKRIVIYGDSVIALYLAYLLKIKNPELYIAIVGQEKNKNKYFFSDQESLKKTQLFSLIDFKKIAKTSYKYLKISNINNKKMIFKIQAKLFDYDKIKKYLYSSCLSQNVDFFLNFEIVSLNKNTVFIENIETNEKKEISYYKFIFVDDVFKNIPISEINFIEEEILSLIVDIKTNKTEATLKILDSNQKTFIFDQPIDEYKRKIIICSKNKDKLKIFEDNYVNEKYKIISKQIINIKTIDMNEKYINDIFFLGFSGGVYNHINHTDIFLQLINAEIISKLITNKIKNKTDIKNYNKEINSVIKEVEISNKIKNLLLSKTSAELDTFFLKINNLKVFENINVSSIRKDLKKKAINPKYFLLLKDFLFK
jgi:hypothetical protein